MYEPKKIRFDLSMYGQIDDPSHLIIEQGIKRGDVTTFAARFVRGLREQQRIHTGVQDSVGGSTAARIANDLVAFAEAITGQHICFDIKRFFDELEQDPKP